MRVYRSHFRMFLFGVVGVLLLVAAVDVMFGHWLSEPPENNEGVLTTRGQAQQRGDIVWGAAMIGTGTLLVGGAFFDLVRRKPVCEVGSSGLSMSIGSGEGVVEIPWTNVRDVYVTSRVDPYDGSTREKLAVSILDRSALPTDLVGADWEGADLLVDAHDWTKDGEDVVRAAQASLGHSRRMAQLRELDTPSGSWETTVAESPDATPLDDEVATIEASDHAAVAVEDPDPVDDGPSPGFTVDGATDPEPADPAAEEGDE